MNSWQTRLGLSLIVISVSIYLIQIMIFKNSHDTFFYLLQDLAFVPIQVLLITFLLNQLLSIREKKILVKKMNMLVGVFFSEAGTDLAKICAHFGPDTGSAAELLKVEPSWERKQFDNATLLVKQHDFKIDPLKGNLCELQEHLLDKRPFFVALLSNPNLLEHDTFTELMWAVLHLTEELAHRPSLEGLPHNDYAHLAGDIKRVYSLLIQEWLAYMIHLKVDYPYLFSLATRTNPFNKEASVIIK